MAAGYYDAEGVWIYGESDSIALFSDLLNLGENSISDQFTADRSRLSTLESSIGTRYVAASSTARDSHFGTPANDTQRLALQNSGAECLRTDLGYTERYFATYNASTNPGGVNVAGWYPVSGNVPQAKIVRNATAVSVSATTWTILSAGFDTEHFDGGMTVASGVITVPLSGMYRVEASVGTQSSATASNRQLAVTLNKSTSGTPTLAQSLLYGLENTNTTGYGTITSAAGIVSLTAGDALRVEVFSSIATTVYDNTALFGKPATYLSVTWLGAKRS